MSAALRGSGQAKAEKGEESKRKASADKSEQGAGVHRQISFEPMDGRPEHRGPFNRSGGAARWERLARTVRMGCTKSLLKVSGKYCEFGYSAVRAGRDMCAAETNRACHLGDKPGACDRFEHQTKNEERVQSTHVSSV